MHVLVLEHPPLFEVSSVTIQHWHTRSTTTEQVWVQADNGRCKPWIGGQVLLEKARVRAESACILQQKETGDCSPVHHGPLLPYVAFRRCSAATRVDSNFQRPAQEWTIKSSLSRVSSGWPALPLEAQCRLAS